MDSTKLMWLAGSFALLGAKVPRDAGVAAKLRAAGAIILGKANLSQWANFRSNNSTSQYFILFSRVCFFGYCEELWELCRERTLESYFIVMVCCPRTLAKLFIPKMDGVRTEVRHKECMFQRRILVEVPVVAE